MGFYGDNMNAQLLEASLSRVWQHARSDRPIALLTAFRGEYDKETNIQRNKELAATIKNMGVGYFFVDGYWIENEGTDREIKVSEDSIFAIGKEGTDAEFLDTMVKLGAKYGQDGVLVKTKDGAKVYDQSGNVSFDVGSLSPGKAGEIYTRLRNNKASNTFVFEGERDEVGFISRLRKLSGLS